MDSPVSRATLKQEQAAKRSSRRPGQPKERDSVRGLPVVGWGHGVRGLDKRMIRFAGR
jgi:hypothetical protein